MVITNKKFAEFAGYQLGQIVADSEFAAAQERYHEAIAAKREADYEAAKASGSSFGKRVVARDYNVGSFSLVRGEIVYVTKINGTSSYRIQRTKSRQSVIATDSMANIEAHTERI